MLLVMMLLIVSLVFFIELKLVNRICVMGGFGSSFIVILVVMLSIFFDLVNSVSRLKLGEFSVFDFSVSVLLFSVCILIFSRLCMVRLYFR